MKNFKFTVILAILMIMLVACSQSNTESKNEPAKENATSTETTNTPTTVEITDINGKVTVPVNPKTVISLDNRTFETLENWGIELVAVPKDVMPKDLSYVKDENVVNIGNHREPNLELIAAANPDLVIVGQRFASYYEDIKKLVPNAAVINLNFDLSETAASPGENFVNGFKDTTLTLGKIFAKDAEAAALVSEFDQALNEAKAAYNGTDKVMGVEVSGGNIGYSAPGFGRVWGPLFEIFEWVPALEIENATSNHKGDEISVEAIAQSNPDWLFVLDRDAAVSSETDSVPAKDVIDNSPALQNVTAVATQQLVYAPNDTYTNESIQTFIEVFKSIKDSLTK